MYQMHLHLLLLLNYFRFQWKQLKENSFFRVELTVVSNDKGTFNGVTVVDDYAHHRRDYATLKAHSTTHTIRYGVSSNHILMQEQRLSSMNLQFFLTRIIWCLQISMQLVRQILSGLLLPVLGSTNLEQMHITFQVLKK